MPPTKKLDLSVKIDVLTAGTTAEIVNAILETLLFQRNQIPFVYGTYRYYVNKWQQHKSKQSDMSGEKFALENFHIQRKKQQATITKEAISSMRKVIKNTFAKKLVKCVRFLFGSTIFTAKEAYTVYIPTESIAVNHFYEQHKILPHQLNQTLLSLLTSQDLYALFSHNLNPTNIYLELEILEKENVELKYNYSLQNSEIFPKDFLPLPASCKEVHIHLLHDQHQTTNYRTLTCCKELQVFEDLTNLYLGNEHEKQNDNRSEVTLINLTSNWWEAETFVRGFKDQPTKGFNIWT